MMVPDESLPSKIQEHKYDLNRSLELYQAYKNRDNEFDLEQLSFDDLVFLAKVASFYFTGQVSKEVEAEEQRGDETASLNRDPSNAACRDDDKFFKKKYVRRKRVGAVSETCNLVKKLCTHKSSEIKQGFFFYNNGETQSRFEVGQCSRTNNKMEATEALVYPKKKRSQRKRKQKELKKNLEERRQGKEQACDQVHNFGEEAETEEEEKGNVSDARNSSSCNPWSGFSFNVQWSNKKKRGSMKLEETQSNYMILLIAAEAITKQLRLLDMNM